MDDPPAADLLRARRAPPHTSTAMAHPHVSIPPLCLWTQLYAAPGAIATVRATAETAVPARGTGNANVPGSMTFSFAARAIRDRSQQYAAPQTNATLT